MPVIDLEKIFTYHPPQEGQAEQYEEIRAAGLDFALIIQVECPVSQEKSLAVTKIREAVMWANAAIAVSELCSAPNAAATITKATARKRAPPTAKSRSHASTPTATSTSPASTRGWNALRWKPKKSSPKSKAKRKSRRPPPKPPCSARS